MKTLTALLATLKHSASSTIARTLRGFRFDIALIKITEFLIIHRDNTATGILYAICYYLPIFICSSIDNRPTYAICTKV